MSNQTLLLCECMSMSREEYDDVKLKEICDGNLIIVTIDKCVWMFEQVYEIINFLQKIFCRVFSGNKIIS